MSPWQGKALRKHIPPWDAAGKSSTEKCQSAKGYACSQKGAIFVVFFVSPCWSSFFLSNEMVRNQVLVGGILGLATIDSDLIGAS